MLKIKITNDNVNNDYYHNSSNNDNSDMNVNYGNDNNNLPISLPYVVQLCAEHCKLRI